MKNHGKFLMIADFTFTPLSLPSCPDKAPIWSVVPFKTMEIMLIPFSRSGMPCLPIMISENFEIVELSVDTQ